MGQVLKLKDCSQASVSNKKSPQTHKESPGIKAKELGGLGTQAIARLQKWNVRNEQVTIGVEREGVSKPLHSKTHGTVKYGCAGPISSTVEELDSSGPSDSAARVRFFFVSLVLVCVLMSLWFC
jgi:hypothetical protein